MSETNQTDLISADEFDKKTLEITDDILLNRSLAEKAKYAEIVVVPEGSRLGQAINLLQKEVDENPRIEHSIQVITKHPVNWRTEKYSLGLSEMRHGSTNVVYNDLDSLAKAAADLHNHPPGEIPFYSPKDIETTISFRNQCSILITPDGNGDKEIIMLINEVDAPIEKRQEILDHVRKIGTEYRQQSDELGQVINSLANKEVVHDEEIQKIVERFSQLEDLGVKDLFNLLISEKFGLFVSQDGKKFVRIKPEVVNG